MKAKNLNILKENGMNVPYFVIVNNANEIDLDVFKDNIKYAIRSSFSQEDNQNSSYAGQFDTVLNVEKKDIVENVLKVKNSYKNKNVKDYERINHLDNSNENNVIIQEMVQSKLSGVLFTANPIGIVNEMVLIVGYGLGNNIVEDKVSTSSYFYNIDDDNLYYEQQKNTPTLSNDILNKLFDLGKRIEKLFDKKMDIEFAIDNNDTIFILQARPITTLDLENPIILDNSNIVESYPGITLPLTQDFVKDIYYKVFKTCDYRVCKNKELIEQLENNLQNMVDVANGRMYYRISNWYDNLCFLPFSKKIIKIWQNMLGVENKQVYHSNIKVSYFMKLKIALNFISLINKTPKEMKKLNSFFDNQLPIYRDKVENANTIQTLYDTYREIEDDLTSCWDITLINDMYTFLYTAFCGKKNKEIISQIKNLESMKPMLCIYEMMNVLKENNCDINNTTYQTLKQSYIDKFGDRCINELKLETKTYRTNPEMLDEYILNKIKNNDSTITTRSVVETKSRNIFVKKAKLGIYNREKSRMNRTQIFGIARSIVIKMGEILYQNNSIENIDDVFYLYFDEILEERENYKNLINERKIVYEFYDKLPVYNRLIFTKNGIINKQPSNISSSKLNLEHDLFGIGTSIGEIQGEVVVITNPNLKIDTRNKIVVTKMTDPGWIFLIEHAKGIIAEKGSLLSHTAIISRELNKPSIVNVKNATSILKTGDFIELNSKTGTIKILKEIN